MRILRLPGLGSRMANAWSVHRFVVDATTDRSHTDFYYRPQSALLEAAW